MLLCRVSNTPFPSVAPSTVSKMQSLHMLYFVTLCYQHTPHHTHTRLHVRVHMHTHIQALIYPLTVATKSQSATRKEAAEMILKNMREHSSALVQQAIMVSEELIRVAILWHEQWHEGLEDASRLVEV